MAARPFDPPIGPPADSDRLGARPASEAVTRSELVSIVEKLVMAEPASGQVLNGLGALTGAFAP